LRRPVDVEVHDFGRSPTIRNRQDLGSSELLNDVTATDNGTGKMECTFAIPQSSSSVIVGSSANGCGERMSWSIVARNRRQVHLDMELVGAPILCQVRFAARRDLDSRKPLSRVLPTSVESAARIVRVVVLTIVELDNVWNNN
jgi:hypothetical protein